METMTNAQLLMEVLGGSFIRFMTWMILFDAPEKLFNDWVDSIGTTTETYRTTRVWVMANVVYSYADDVLRERENDAN